MDSYMKPMLSKKQSYLLLHSIETGITCGSDDLLGLPVRQLKYHSGNHEGYLYYFRNIL